MARVPTGVSVLSHERPWHVDETSLAWLSQLLDKAPLPPQIAEIERVVADYLHARDAYNDGANHDDTRAELAKFRDGLSAVIRFLDVVDDARQHAIGAANLLLARELDFDRLPKIPGAAITDLALAHRELADLALAFDAAASNAIEAKPSKAKDPARVGLYADLYRVIERQGGQPTIRGHQGGRPGENEEPWSKFAEFAFAVACSVADHAGAEKPQRNSGFPFALRTAVKSRETKIEN